MSSTPSATTKENDISRLEGRAVMFDVLKGGYGKSALSVNLADRLAARGHDVLYLDLDPNGHVSFALGYDDVYHDGMHDYGFVALDKKMYSKEDRDPEHMIYETDYGFDFVPSFNDMESFEAALKDEPRKEEVLGREFLLPLYNAGAYDFFVMDGGGERSIIADNGFYAGKTGMVPLAPGDEALSAMRRTWNRVVQPLQKKTGFDILAIVPNLLSKRIDHQNDDRVLLERLNSSDRFSELLPEFAQFTEDDWADVDAGTYEGLPGIREREGISGGVSQGMPVSAYDPDCDQIEHFDELARIVETGGVDQ